MPSVQQCLCYCHDWSLCLELRNSAHCVFLKFAKAFDCVAYEHLIKLQCLDIDGRLLEWIYSFLTHSYSELL